MSGEQPRVEKLRAFLQELGPQAQALLIDEIERAHRRRETIPGADLVLELLRGTARLNGGREARVDHVCRLFFRPIEPFLVDGIPARKHRGRIARGSIAPIWRWIGRDLMPRETAAFCEEVEPLLQQAREAEAEAVASRFRETALPRIREAVAATAGNDKAQRRLTAQVGEPRALEDLRDIVGALQVRDPLARLAADLPLSIPNFAPPALDQVKALLDHHAGRNPSVLLYGLVLIMRRLTVPPQLVRIAVLAAETDIAARVEQTPYGLAGTLVFDEIDAMVDRLRHTLQSGPHDQRAPQIKAIHDAVRLVRTELDLGSDSGWARRLATVRADVSALLQAQIDDLPGRARRLLRMRPVKDIAPGSALDGSDVEDVEAALELLAACRTHASELALNEATTRLNGDLQQCLDQCTSVLLDNLRTAGDRERRYLLSQVDAAIRFARKLFGASYAALLAKAAEVAAQDERRAANA